jgi:hypothetical protein
VKTDPRPFVEAALSGLASRPIHASAAPDGKGGVAVVPGVDPSLIGQRAVELGLATAAAFDKALEQLKDDATRPVAPKRKAG